MLLWSTVATSNKMALTQLNSSQLWLISTGTCLVFLFIIMMIQKKFSFIRNMSFRELLFYFILGMLSPFLNYFLTFKTYSLLSGQISSLILTSWSVVLPIMAIPVLKKIPSIRECICIIIAFIGVFIVASNGNISSFENVNLYGILCGLLTTVVFSTFWLYNAKSSCDPVVSLFLCFLFSFPCIAVTVLFSTQLPTAEHLVPGVVCAMYTGLAEMGIPYLLWLAALRNTDSPSKISTIILFCPCFALFILSSVLGEKILWSTIVGLILISYSNLLQQQEVMHQITCFIKKHCCFMK